MGSAKRLKLQWELQLGGQVSVTTIDPSTGRPLDTYEETTPEQLDSLLDEARSAQRAWRELSPNQR